MKSRFWLLTSMFFKINLILITNNMIFENACIKAGASAESFVTPCINIGWVFQKVAWSKIQQGFSLKIYTRPILENMLGNMPSTYTYKFGPSFYNIYKYCGTKQYLHILLKQGQCLYNINAQSLVRFNMVYPNFMYPTIE
jgi:hypothetical protein